MSLLDYFDVSSLPLLAVALALALMLMINSIITSINRRRKLPPGPWGLPIVGYLPFINDDSYLFFDRLAKKYGPVFSLRLGQHDVVVICDWEHLKLAFADESLLARPLSTFKPGDVPSFMEMSGDIWREHRRLSLHILRDVGFGKSAMENLITKEINQFLPTLEGRNVDFIKKVQPSVANIISSFLFGKASDYSDPLKIQLDTNVERVAQALRFASLQAFLPWMIKILAFFGFTNFEKFKKGIAAIESVIQKHVDDHVAKDKDSHEIVDYIDGYLQEHERRKIKGEDDNMFNLHILRRNATVFFGAGSETITSTLSWGMMFLAARPEYQEKIRDEISEVIGYERDPNYTDRNQMPFTMAFLYEVQRTGSVIATNLLRRATSDTKIGNFFIPKEATVVFNLWSIHREEKLWPDPERFDPNRFLTDNGTKAFKPPYLVPFSSGKRNCPGESLANVELFLYTVSILQRYRIKPEKIDSDLLSEAVYGIARRPKHLPPLTFEKFKP
uniref:Cytochrome P450 monooxygenase n=2 Tax=Panonychus citri TaxID=50023 RepID=V9MH57_PANCT|nr:cytochrome P450 monooxygenase [Panonychus citri]